MKHLFNCLLLVTLMSLMSSKTLAYDIAVKNDDGVTIYYNYINDKSELEVTYRYYSLSAGYGFSEGYEGLDKITVPSEVLVSGSLYKVTGIGYRAFGGYGRSSSVPFTISQITLPEGLRYIGEEAFEACKKITSINVSDIGASAFESTPLKSFVIPSSVTYFGDYALSGCGKLESVTISASNVTITEKAFNKSNSLKKIEYLSDDIGTKGPLFEISSLGIDTVVVPEKAYPYLTENSEWEKCDRICASIMKRLFCNGQFLVPMKCM